MCFWLLNFWEEVRHSDDGEVPSVRISCAIWQHWVFSTVFTWKLGRKTKKPSHRNSDGDGFFHQKSIELPIEKRKNPVIETATSAGFFIKSRVNSRWKNEKTQSTKQRRRRIFSSKVVWTPGRKTKKPGHWNSDGGGIFHQKSLLSF